MAMQRRQFVPLSCAELATKQAIYATALESDLNKATAFAFAQACSTALRSLASWQLQMVAAPPPLTSAATPTMPPGVFTHVGGDALLFNIYDTDDSTITPESSQPSKGTRRRRRFRGSANGSPSGTSPSQSDADTVEAPPQQDLVHVATPDLPVSTSPGDNSALESQELDTHEDGVNPPQPSNDNVLNTPSSCDAIPATQPSNDMVPNKPSSCGAISAMQPINNDGTNMPCSGNATESTQGVDCDTSDKGRFTTETHASMPLQQVARPAQSKTNGKRKGVKRVGAGNPVSRPLDNAAFASQELDTHTSNDMVPSTPSSSDAISATQPSNNDVPSVLSSGDAMECTHATEAPPIIIDRSGDAMESTHASEAHPFVVDHDLFNQVLRKEVAKSLSIDPNDPHPDTQARLSTAVALFAKHMPDTVREQVQPG